MPETVIASLIAAIVGLTGTAALAAARRSGETRDLLLRFGAEVRLLTSKIATHQEQLTDHIHESGIVYRELSARISNNEQRIATLEGSMERRRPL